MNKKLDYGIEIFYDILSENERLKCLTQFKPLLEKVNIGYTKGFPGLQTPSNLHELSETPFEEIKKVVGINHSIHKSWVNYTDEKLKYTHWHNHSGNKHYQNVCVYMIENPEHIGTWFWINNNIYKVKAPTNSLLVFPCSLTHTVPSEIKEPRYSLSIDFY